MRTQLGEVLAKLAVCLLMIPCAALAQSRIVVPCTDVQISAANSALSHAKSATDRAISAFDANGQDVKKQLVVWFGIPGDGSYQKVRNTLAKASSFFSGATFRCVAGSSPRKQDVYAFVNPGIPFTLALGSLFFDAQEIGYDSRLGVIIHEFTHFYLAGNTEDEAYGQDNAKRLAISNPEKAMKNADNYEYLVESLESN